MSEFEKHLGERLQSIVPEPPPGLGSGAEAYARRARARRRAAAMAGSVGVVLAAVAVPWALRGDDDGAGPEPTPASQGPVAVAEPGPLACPDRDAHPAAIPGYDGNPLPPGAVRAILCDWHGVPFVAPRDVLERDVAELVEVVNGLGPADAQQACTEEMGPGFAVLFQYPDETIAGISGELYGCRVVTLGASSARQGAAAVWDGFRERLAEQRRETSPPSGLRAELTCDRAQLGSTPVVDARTLDLTRATLCIPDALNNPGSPVAVPDDLRGRINDEYAEHSRPVESTPPEGSADPEDPDGSVSSPDQGSCADPRPVELVGSNAWGDVLVLVGTCRVFTHGDRSFTMSEASWQALRALG